MFFALLILLAYIIGSVPSSVWLGRRFYGVDVRDHGSGNAGATNTFRVLGKGPGVAVLALDVLKGMAASGLVFLQHRYGSTDQQWVNLKLLFGMAAVVGHLYPIFAGFRGGKGIATLFGMLLAIHWMSAVACLLVFLVILFATRYVSLSSMAAALAFPILTVGVFQKDNPYYIAFAVGAAVLVFLTHQKNIKRLVTGMENKARIFKHRDR